MELRYQTYQLPFKHPFSISQGRTKTHQPLLVVELSLGPWRGVGEVAEIAYYNEPMSQMLQVLQTKKRMIEKFAFTEPGRYWHYLHHLLPNNPFLVSALDMAAWDLFGCMKNRLLHQYWQTEWQNLPVTNYTIGIDSIEKMVQKVKEQPWPIYKVKLGSAHDIAIVQAIRQVTDAKIRVDANAGWSLSQALEILPQLHELGVEMVEQPLAKDDWDGMKQLYEQSPLPLFADESCVFEADVLKCVGHFHGINIKFAKCSGITPALRMIEQAHKLGLQVMMGSMNESSIGSAAIAQLLPQIDLVDMDGPLLKTEDLAGGLMYYANGSVQLMGKTGLGILPNAHLFKED